MKEILYAVQKKINSNAKYLKETRDSMSGINENQRQIQETCNIELEQVEIYKKAVDQYIWCLEQDHEPATKKVAEQIFGMIKNTVIEIVTENLNK